jgi:hypothetical protein
MISSEGVLSVMPIQRGSIIGVVIESHPASFQDPCRIVEIGLDKVRAEMHHRIIAKDRGESVIRDRSKVVATVRIEHSVPEPGQTCPAILYVLLVNIHQSKLARTFHCG